MVIILAGSGSLKKDEWLRIWEGVVGVVEGKLIRKEGKGWKMIEMLEDGNKNNFG